MTEPRSVWEAYELQARKSPAAPAVCIPNPRVELTYAAVISRSLSIARSLKKRHGDRERVGILVGRTHADFLPLLLAVGRHGAFVLLSTDLPDKEQQRERNQYLLDTLQLSLVVVEARESFTDLRLTAAWAPLAELSEEEGECLGEDNFDPDAVLSFMCTGGSQHLKIAKVTHRMMLHERRAYPALCQISGVRLLQNLRSFWPAAVVGQLSLALALEGCAVICSCDVTQMRQLVLDENVDVLGLVPDQLSLLAEDASALPQLRLVISWAERLPLHLAQKWRGVRILELLIATEYWLSFAGDPLKPERIGEDRWTVFYPVSDVGFVVLDEGKRVQEGLGELCLRGPMVSPGYVAGEAFLDFEGQRYFRTHDLVQLLPGGGFIYRGRGDRWSKVKGQWVDLNALEHTLQDTEGVKEACLVESDLVHAFVSLDETLSLPVRRLKDLLPWRSYLHVLPVLPRTATGKVNVKSLQARLERPSSARVSSRRQRLRQTWLQHGSLALAAALVSFFGEAATTSIWLGFLGPCSLAYGWLGLAHLSVRKLPDLGFTRMSGLLALHALPFRWARQLRALLALYGLQRALSRRRLSWPLVFWLGSGTQLHLECVRARGGLLMGLLRQLGYTVDGVDEVVKLLLGQLRGLFSRRRNWNSGRRGAPWEPSRTIGTQWEEHPMDEKDVLQSDLWTAESVLATETTLPSWPCDTEESARVELSQRSIDWALENFPSPKPWDESMSFLRHVIPETDPDASLASLDSLRVSFIASALQAQGHMVSGEEVRQARSLRALVAQLGAAKAAPRVAAASRMPAPKSEYAIWFTPGQMNPMGPWLCRSRRVVVKSALQRALTQLRARHVALRAASADPVPLRSFMLNCAALLCASEAEALPPFAQRAVGCALFRAWPRVRVPGAQRLEEDHPLSEVEVHGQTELEWQLGRGNTPLPSPFEVLLIQLVLPVVGVWECDGGHISIVRSEGELVYVDAERWLAAKLGAELNGPALFAGLLPDGGGVWLRFPTSSQLQVSYRPSSTASLTTFTATRIPQPSDQLETISFVMMQCSHAFADGYCFPPIASDLFTYVNLAESGELQANGALPATDAFRVLEQRLAATLRFRLDPNRHSLRGSLWGASFKGYSCSLSLEGGTLKVLKAVASNYQVPLNYLLLAIVTAAQARASHAQAVEMTLYVPMRDGIESGMVGLFADWRDITVSTDFEDATILGVILEVADILRLRRWTVFDAVRKAERTVVNFDQRDVRDHSGFVQVSDTFWRPGRARNWNQWEWLAQPLQIDLVEEHHARWHIYVRMCYELYPVSWRRDFVQGIRDATWYAIFQPWQLAAWPQDMVIPWHSSKEGGVSFQEDLVFDKPRNSMQVKIEMKQPKEWGYFGGGRTLRAVRVVQPAFVSPAQPLAIRLQVPTKTSQRTRPSQQGSAAALLGTAALIAAVGQRRRVAVKAKSEDQPDNFLAAVGRRASLALPSALVAGAPAYAEYEIIDLRGRAENGCIECGTSGLVNCNMCEGTGQYRTWGTPQERTPVQQYLTCPECNGLGEKVCQKCGGTGLPAKKLKGLLRDPIFAKVAFRLKRQRVDVNTVDKMKADVRKAVAAAEKRSGPMGSEVRMGLWPMLRMVTPRLLSSTLVQLPHLFRLLPAHRHDHEPLEAAPSYRSLEAWSAHPRRLPGRAVEDANLLQLPGDSLPPALARPCDCFFVHDSTFIPAVCVPFAGEMQRWNAPLERHPELVAKINEQTDLRVAVGAGPFNKHCRIYAPRYRQVNVLAIAALALPPGIKSQWRQLRQALDLAYDDIRRAFLEFVESTDTKGRPFIVVGHSQGTIHLTRLLQEEVDPYPERHQRFVHGYLTGMTVPLSIFRPLKQVRPSDHATDICTVSSWRTAPPGILVAVHCAMVFHAESGWKRFGGEILATNPITWHRGPTLPSKASEYLGSAYPLPSNLELGDGWLTSGVSLRFGAACMASRAVLGARVAALRHVHCGEVTAQVDTGGATRVPKLPSSCLFSHIEDDFLRYHDVDIALFFGNLRANVAQRCNMWMHQQRELALLDGTAVHSLQSEVGCVGPAPVEPSKVHSRGLVEPSRRVGPVGPAPRPSMGAMAFTEVHEPSRPRPGPAIPDPKAPDAVAISGCRRGELPPSGWSSKWSFATKRAALLAALEESQMHVVYALRPHSNVWQESMQSADLEQAELDRLLREKVLTKPRPTQKQRLQEAKQWLLEAGASLEALCSDKDFEVRKAAAALLAEGEGAAARAAKLLGSEDANARSTAAEALGRMGKDATPHGAALAALLGDADTTVRMAATAALGRLGGALAKHCAEALGSEKPREREAACEALGLMGASAAEHGAAIAELLQDSDWQVPTAAGSALKRLGSSQVKHCAEVLGRCRTTARPAVAEAIVRIGGADAAESLVPLLRSRDQGVRKYAADCLGQLGAEARPFAQFLAPLKEDSDREVKRSAMQALIKLGLGPAPRTELGNGDEMPPPPDKGSGKGKDGKDGKGKGKRKDGDREGGALTISHVACKAIPRDAGARAEKVEPEKPLQLKEYRASLVQAHRFVAMDAETALEIRHLQHARIMYPVVTHKRNFQTIVSADLNSSWYQTPNQSQLARCDFQEDNVAVFRGNFFRVWEYGHILHDLLPGLVWLSAAQPHAKLIIERTIKLPEFLEWFDSELYARALFLPSNQVLCARQMSLLVPRWRIRHPEQLRSAEVFLHFRRHLRPAPTAAAAAQAALYVARTPDTAKHGRWLVPEEEEQLLQSARRSLEKTGKRLSVFIGTSWIEQFQAFSSASLVFGAHGTAMANLLWMPITCPKAAVIEFVCSKEAMHVVGCTFERRNGLIRSTSYWGMEGGLVWLRYFHVLVLDSSSNFSKYMRVDLHGFQLALDEALR
ncbi:unnamed protein product [Effrenium voratum]|nr:unnamed protein product [Effrenium voratum]